MKHVLLVVFLSPLLLGARPLQTIEPLLVDFSQYEWRNETYDISAIEPVDVKALIDAAPDEASRKKLVRKLYWQRIDAHGILLNVKSFVILRSLRVELVPRAQRRNLIRHLRRILSGKSAFLVVTPYGDPYTIWELFGVGLDLGAGIPLESRLVGRGMQKLPRTFRYADHAALSYVPPFGPPQVHEEISSFLSQSPRRMGDIGEVRTLTRAEDAPYDFAEVLYYKALSRHWFFRGGTRIPAEERLPPLDGSLLRQAQDLKSRFPSIPDDLLFPEQQTHYGIDFLYAHTLTPSRSRLFRNKFSGAVQYAVPPFIDLDFPPVEDPPEFRDRRAHILKASREEAETTTREALSRIRHHFLVQEGENRPNHLQVFDCSSLLNAEDYDVPSLRPGRPDGIIVADPRAQILPSNSYLRMMMDQYYPLPAMP